jgi:hypothetical protein
MQPPARLRVLLGVTLMIAVACAEPVPTVVREAVPTGTPVATVSGDTTSCVPTDTPDRFTLCLTIEGSGHISSINEQEFHCPPDCSESYRRLDETNAAPYWDAHVSAFPDERARFLGWTGPACEPDTERSCMVTMDRDRNITARFTDTGVAPSVLVEKRGTGSGTVVSDPPGMLCGDQCTMMSRSGAFVTLKAIPDPGSKLASWKHSGSCYSPEPNCRFMVNGAEHVTATFSAT